MQKLYIITWSGQDWFNNYRRPFAELWLGELVLGFEINAI
jgi:hypothetical protein